MISYFIYARKSTESEDRQALSINAQISELESLAEKDNLKIEKVFTESKSAKQSGRPVFNNMIKELKQNKVSGILCWKLDRLTRNLLDGATISDLMEKGNIEEIRTPMQVYRNNSVDRLMSGIDMLFARKYVDDLSDNVKRGMMAKVRQGWLPVRAPIGYINDRGVQGSRKINPDPDRFKLVRKMWDLMLSENYSINQILDIVNNRWGFKTIRTKRIGGVPLPRSSLHKIFTNPFYAGQFYYGGELHQGKHTPMITGVEFEQVQYLLGKKEKAKPEKHQFDFTGIFRCGLCGSMITAENKFKYLKSTKRTKKYIYYHCTYGKDPYCPRQSITEEDLIEQIEVYLKDISLPHAYLDWIYKYFDSVRFNELEKREQEKQSLKREIKNIDRKLENLMGLKISQENKDNRLISDDEYLHHKNKLTQEKVRLSSAIRNYFGIGRRFEELTREVFELSVYARHWFQNGDRERRRIILNKIFSNHEIMDKKVLMKAKKPFEIISTLNLPGGLTKNSFEPENFGLDITKNTTSCSATMGIPTTWYTQLDELGKILKKMSTLSTK